MSKPRRVVECDKITMKITRVWNSTLDADRDLGLRPTTTYARCKGKRVSNGKYVYRFLDDYDPNEVFTLYHRPVLAINTINKKKYAFYSVEEAAEYLCVSNVTLTHGITTQKPICYGLYMVKYIR